MNNDEQEIRHVVVTWMRATKMGDVDTVLSLMTEDVVFLLPGQPAKRKADFAAKSHAQAGKNAPMIDGNSDIKEIQVCGDWAFMWSQLEVIVTLPDGAPPIVRSGPTLTIFKKENGKWLLARDANMTTVASE